jgi:hypothetical protein
MVGDVVEQDLEGWVYGDCTEGDDSTGSWTSTCTKTREDADGNVETEAETYVEPNWENIVSNTVICFNVERTNSAGDITDSFSRTCNGERVITDGTMGGAWVLETHEGDQIER